MCEAEDLTYLTAGSMLATDNAAMIAIVGQYKFADHDFGRIDAPAFSKVTFK